MDDELMEQVEEEIDDAPVVTVPIDDTLTHSGEAADAKKVGDQLALKADKTEIPASITVNGKSKDNNNNIAVYSADIPYASGSGQQTVKEKIDDLNARTADDIPMEEGGTETIADAVDDINEDIEELQTDVAAEMSDEEIEDVFDEVFGEEDEEA